MKKQKFLVLLVALCMLVSLVPAVAAPAAQATDTATQVIKLVAPEGHSGNLTEIDIDVSGWEMNQNATHPDVWTRFSNTSACVAYNVFTKFIYNYVGEYAAIDFKVNESGYYDIDLVTDDYGGYTTEVSTTIDGAAMNNVKWLGDNSTETAKNLGVKYLTEGVVHTLVMKAAANANYVFVRAINLTPTEAPKAEAGYSKTFNLFDIQNRGSFKNMTISSNGWEIDEATTSAPIYAQMMGTGSARPETAIYNSSSKFQFGNGEDVGIAFMVDATGYYDLSTKFLLYKGTWCTAVQIFVDDMAVGSVDAYDVDGNPDGTLTNIKLKNRVYLEAGRHVFKLHQTGGGGDRVLINSFTLTASDVQEAEAETPFGYRYALVKNSAAGAESEYSLFVISAIDGTDYKNAGFDLKVNGNTKTETTQNVYTQFNFTNSGAGNWVTYVRPADFGCNNGYIYYVEYKLSAEEVNAAMEITAFVTDAEDNKISGNTVAVAAK